MEKTYTGQFHPSWGALEDRSFEVDYKFDNWTAEIEVQEVRVLSDRFGQRVMPEWFVAILVSDKGIMQKIENHSLVGSRG